jgi:hypothetical protein
VERIRGNVGVDSAAVLADCDRLDALSEAIEGLGGETQEGGESPPAPTLETPAPAEDQPQG